MTTTQTKTDQTLYPDFESAAEQARETGDKFIEAGRKVTNAYLDGVEKYVHGIAQFQRKLGAESKTVHLMSISIDPEEDTPARLAEYAKKFGASPQWQHYTGTLAASVAAQRAFDVYRGEKMSHTPVTLLRSAPGKPWLRIDGFVTPDELLREYRNLLASK